MNPFEQSKQRLLHFLTSQVEQEVIDYIRQEMQHNVSDSIPTEDEPLAFFQSSDESTKLDAYQQMLSIGKLFGVCRDQSAAPLRSDSLLYHVCPAAAGFNATTNAHRVSLYGIKLTWLYDLSTHQSKT